MATKIVFCNLKGGVGKTTVCCSLSAGFARRGKRTLIIDLDPQGQSGVWFFGKRILFQDDGTVRDVLDIEREPSQRPHMKSIISKALPGIDVAISNLKLAAIDKKLAIELKGRFVLREVIQPLENDYDFILFDTAPSLSSFTESALIAADTVIVPTTPEYLSLVGTELVKNTINNINDIRAEHVKGAKPLQTFVLINRVKERLILTRDIIELLKKVFGGIILKTQIRENVRIAEAPSHLKSIMDHDPNSPGAQDFENLTQEVLSILEPKK